VPEMSSGVVADCDDGEFTRQATAQRHAAPQREWSNATPAKPTKATAGSERSSTSAPSRRRTPATPTSRPSTGGSRVASVSGKRGDLRVVRADLRAAKGSTLTTDWQRDERSTAPTSAHESVAGVVSRPAGTMPPDSSDSGDTNHRAEPSFTPSSPEPLSLHQTEGGSSAMLGGGCQ
jgi:hypothetical protein